MLSKQAILPIARVGLQVVACLVVGGHDVAALAITPTFLPSVLLSVDASPFPLASPWPVRPVSCCCIIISCIMLSAGTTGMVARTQRHFGGPAAFYCHGAITRPEGHPARQPCTWEARVVGVSTS